MASLDRQVTQNGLGLSMQLQGERTMVSLGLPSVAMMRGGVGDVEPYLYSRNTIGHGNHNPKSQRPKCVKIFGDGSGYAMVVAKK